MSDPSVPTFAEERRLAAGGFVRIAGIDEAGRGPLAGPVVAAAVVLPLDLATTWLGWVRDSKQLTATARQRLFPHIYQDAVAVGVGCIDSDDIDRIGIVPATRRAMRLAVESLAPPPEAVLIDYMAVPEIGLPQNEIPTALLCFNIGVEVGQVLFVAVLIAVMHFGGRVFARPSDRPAQALAMRVRGPAAYVVGSLASYWLIARIGSFVEM